jgi:prepilin-type N-terminal cleavage/methylation domain-containing protein
MRPIRQSARACAQGFSLVELAVVMVILGFLMGGLFFTLSTQTEQRSFEETRRRLDQARELLLAFALINGRLPCPARSAATASPVTVAGDEVRTVGATPTDCIGDAVTDHYGGASGGVTLGLLPARAIGFQQLDSAGFAIDAWGNRIRYAVARTITNCSGSSATPHFTNATNLKNNGISCQSNDLLICRSATGSGMNEAGSPPTCGASGGNQIMTSGLVVAIVFSTGKNGSVGGTGADEAENLDGGALFVWHAPASSNATNGEFDDQMTWITVGELYGKLIAGGQLP